MIIECCICRDWYDKDRKRWYPPSREDRREGYIHRRNISHGYCLECLPIMEREMEKTEGIHLEHKK